VGDEEEALPKVVGGDESDGFFGEVDVGLDEGQDVAELVLEFGCAGGEGPVEKLFAGSQLGVGFGVDQRGDAFDLAEVELAGEEGPGGELAGFGESGALCEAFVQDHGQDRRGAEGVQFDDVLLGVTARGTKQVCLGGEVGRRLRGHQAQPAQHVGMSGPISQERGCLRHEEAVCDGDGQGTAQAYDASGAVADGGRDRCDGVVDHVEHESVLSIHR